MMILLASGRKAVECNVCHDPDVAEGQYVTIAPDIHVCEGCKPYQSQAIGFFAWYIQLEQLYKQHGKAYIPRDGRYTEDWPIRYFKQGFSPQHAIDTMETAMAS